MGARKLRFAALTKTVAVDATAAAGATPTKAEFDKVVTLANELKADLNKAIDALKK